MPASYRPFQTLLIANRGEIALRILHSARRLGLRTVAVYSDADRHSPHVAYADSAVHIGGAAARESYLNIPAILNAAQRGGADAIHPGYGFLAENADFATAVAEAGLIFVGPSATAIHAMGNKAEAKRLMLACGMPCIPGYQDSDQDDAHLMAAAQRIGYPIMVKAAAGGGGRGMRLVHEPARLQAALTSARSEALSAFGSAQLIMERALVQPRHIEIQVFGDSHGEIIHLGERDCSIQRRHQKIIEEAPSPAVSEALRTRMGAAAVQAARAIDYVGAGTIEFLLDQDDNFYFMEMNTRLQVEHAVTEAITGFDLVEWQLRIAAGEALPVTQQDVQFSGHAIELRLTAEDVAAGFLPQGGPVLRWRPALHDPGIRIEHALEEGGVISPYYDSMIAKLIAHGRDRDEARRKLQLAIEHCVLLGVPTNQAFLSDCLRHPAFIANQVHTGFVDQHMPAAMQTAMPSASVIAAAALAAAGLLTPPSLDALSPAPAQLTLSLGETAWHIRLRLEHGAWLVELHANGDDATALPQTLAIRCLRSDAAQGRALLEYAGRAGSLVYALDAQSVHIFCDGRAWNFLRHDARRQKTQQISDGALIAPLGARIIAVHARDGDHVQAGQILLVLEAMKMEHSITAPFAGELTELCARVGEQARAGAVLARIQAEPVQEKTS